MTVTRRPAGEARERPRPVSSTRNEAAGGSVIRKNVGAAPVFDAGAKRLTAAGAVSEAAPRGMISNAWVKHWSGAAPPPSVPVRVAASPPQPQKKAAGARQSAGESHGRRKTPK